MYLAVVVVYLRRDFEVGEIVLKESPLISLDLKNR